MLVVRILATVTMEIRERSKTFGFVAVAEAELK